MEFGCGAGLYAFEAAQFVGPTGQISAIDISGRSDRGRKGALRGSSERRRAGCGHHRVAVRQRDIRCHLGCAGARIRPRT